MEYINTPYDPEILTLWKSLGAEEKEHPKLLMRITKKYPELTVNDHINIWKPEQAEIILKKIQQLEGSNIKVSAALIEGKATAQLIKGSDPEALLPLELQEDRVDLALTPANNPKKVKRIEEESLASLEEIPSLLKEALALDAQLALAVEVATLPVIDLPPVTKAVKESEVKEEIKQPQITKPVQVQVKLKHLIGVVLTLPVLLAAAVYLLTHT